MIRRLTVFFSIFALGLAAASVAWAVPLTTCTIFQPGCTTNSGGVSQVGFVSYCYGGLNNNGEVAGLETETTSDTSGIYTGFWGVAGGTTQQIGTLPGGLASPAYGINDSGVLVGAAYDGSSVQHAYTYSNGTLNPLADYPGGSIGFGFAINDAGVVGGKSATSSGTARTPIWNPDSSVVDLNAVMIAQALPPVPAPRRSPPSMRPTRSGSTPPAPVRIRSSTTCRRGS